MKGDDLLTQASLPLARPPALAAPALAAQRRPGLGPGSGSCGAVSTVSAAAAAGSSSAAQMRSDLRGGTSAHRARETRSLVDIRLAERLKSMLHNRQLQACQEERRRHNQPHGICACSLCIGQQPVRLAHAGWVHVRHRQEAARVCTAVQHAVLPQSPCSTPASQRVARTGACAGRRPRSTRRPLAAARAPRSAPARRARACSARRRLSARACSRGPRPRLRAPARRRAPAAGRRRARRRPCGRRCSRPARPTWMPALRRTLRCSGQQGCAAQDGRAAPSRRSKSARACLAA